MTRILVIRHGFSENNAVRRFTGQANAPLSALGREQAELLADYLCHTEQIAAVYASDLDRATDTVAPTAARLGLAVIPEPALRETDVGDWTNRVYEEVETTDKEAMARHRTDPDFPIPGGESNRQVFDRVTACVHRLAVRHKGQTVVLATHAMPARCIEAMSEGHGIEQIGAHRVAPNASVRAYAYDNGKLTSLGPNVVSHLEKQGERLPTELV